VAATLAACAGAIASNQRAELAAKSKRFASLRSAARTRQVHRNLQRWRPRQAHTAPLDTPEVVC